MTQQVPAGWYPDPAPGQPGSPPQSRWWDGERWTEHLQPAPYQQGPVPPGARPVATTPDGQRLAGWWHRVGAYLIDWLILLVVSVAFGFPFVRRIGAVYVDFFDASMRAAENGTKPPSQLDVMGQITGPLLGYLAVSLAISLVYNAGFLKWLQATPGKLAVGLRVRLREQPGPLPWRAILLRWLVQNAATFVSAVPFAGSAAGLFSLLDGLWPLWDDKLQAIHDKAGRTNVVRVRG